MLIAFNLYSVRIRLEKSKECLYLTITFYHIININFKKVKVIQKFYSTFLEN